MMQGNNIDHVWIGLEGALPSNIGCFTSHKMEEITIVEKTTLVKNAINYEKIMKKIK